MAWWDKLKQWFGNEGNAKKPSVLQEQAKWLAPSENPFGVAVLDLISITGGMISTSRDLNAATMAMSWSRKTAADLPLDFQIVETLDCDLRYPSEEDLPDGFLYTAPAMEQKYVIAYRKGQILVARSWTGAVQVVAETRPAGAEVVVEKLHLCDDSLKVFGDPVETFDWLLRAHALDQNLPLPVCDSAAKMLEAVPLSIFSVFGNVARYAAKSWSPPPPSRKLRSCSALITAVRLEQHSEIARLAASGHSLNSREPTGGYTALHVAAIKGSVELTRQLLDLGANPNVLADRDACVLVTGLVHKAPPALLELLVERGADARSVNVDGFGALHALAEIDQPQALRWLLSLGLNIEQRTHKGYTPLQIAAALGHVAALKALLEAGADPAARSAEGTTARDIAVAQGKTESLSALEAWAQRPS